MVAQRLTEHLFVVRLTRERGASRTSPWRGSIDHLGTGARQYFRRLADVVEFVAERLAASNEETNPPAPYPLKEE